MNNLLPHYDIELSIQVEKRVLHKRASAALLDIQQSTGFLLLELRAFTQEEVEMMVNAVLDAELSPWKLARLIWDMTAGWPLYAEQVII